MRRIAIGGWQHETNTFASVFADYDAFARADEWPALGRGRAMLDNIEGVHLPITGAIETLRSTGYEVVPLLWCSATPCSYVTRCAFETIAGMFLDELEAALPVDGIYLDLHGAMVCEHLEDGEGELLRRIRDTVGSATPIAVSLDLHANVTRAMVEHADVLEIFRTYPHVDMGETGARAAAHLHQMIASGRRWRKSFGRTGFLIPLNFGCTLVEPCKTLYDRLAGCIGADVPALSFAPGFHLSDIEQVGPSVIAYAADQQTADRARDRMLDWIAASENEFKGRILGADEAVAESRRLVLERGPTVVLADTQDNPGGGGPGDTTGLLEALVAGGADRAVFGLLADAATVADAAAAGTGAVIDARLGGKSGLPGHRPFETRAEVISLHSGELVATGPMYRGARMRLGPSARLRVGGVDVLVGSTAVQTADQAILRHFGIEPAERDLLALKSSVHFRNDFESLASAILTVAAPGPVQADPAALDYARIRPGVRLVPGDAGSVSGGSRSKRRHG